MSLRVAGMGTSVPTGSIAQAEAARVWAEFAGVDGKRARTIQALYRRSGVKKRHSTLLQMETGDGDPQQTFFQPARFPDDPGPTTEARMKRYEADAPRLGRSAAHAALSDAQVTPSEITHFVTVSCTGFFAPGMDTTLIDLLGLPSTVERTHVGFMGCHGALNGLRVASAFAGADPSARILVSAVELCTLHMSYVWDPDTLIANSLFGDGAAALVGFGDEAPVTSRDWRLASSGTCRLPKSADAMSWRIGDHGFRMTLSASVPDIIQANLSEWMQEWLGKNGMGPGDIATWAIHPGGPRILTASAAALGLDSEANATSRDVLSQYGNMSSATILFILERLRKRHAARPCVALAFGPGLVAEACLFL